MDKKVYSALEVADEIVSQSNAMNIKISNLRLQKCLYFVQALSYVERDQPAFDDDIEAWHYGPVVRKVYSNFAYLGAMPISNDELGFMSFEMNEDGKMKFSKTSREEVSQDLKDIIKMLLEQSKEYTDFQLVDLSHKDGTPWADVYETNQINLIPKEKVRNYFRKINGKDNGI